MLNGTLSRIRIYPIKSLDPVDLTRARVGSRSLLYDRSIAMVADDGRYVNGKRTGRVNQLQADYDLDNKRVWFSRRGQPERHGFHWHEDQIAVEQYLSDFFEMNVRLAYSDRGELMDMPDASSVTVLSSASLESFLPDMPGKTLEDLRLRFRANLEIEGIPAFGEEELCSEPGSGVRFQIGEVEMIGISPRARCNVPPRDPFTGETDKSFIKSMIQSRAATLPAGSRIPEYGSLYYLTVNVLIPDGQETKSLSVGDRVRVLGPVQFEQAG